MRVANPGFLVYVLVAVDEPPRTRTLDVGDEGIEAKVNVIVAVVNVARGVVRNEDIDWGKRGHQVLNLRLLVEEVSARLVAPRTVETAEAHPVNDMSGKVKVNDGWREWLTAVVVAFDGQDVCASGSPPPRCKAGEPTANASKHPTSP